MQMMTTLQTAYFMTGTKSISNIWLTITFLDMLNEEVVTTSQATSLHQQDSEKVSTI